MGIESYEDQIITSRLPIEAVAMHPAPVAFNRHIQNSVFTAINPAL